jgi:predicted GIY-YIG superfamily endonuclease
MTELTSEQKEFLILYGIKSNEIIDASGLRREEYSAIMKANNIKVAYGVTPCAKNNHSLRNRSGNCLQCYPASIGYEKNHNRGGFVYIAQSKVGKIIKIGTTENILARTKTLNEQRYGTQSDWYIPVAREVAKNCGQIEKAMHAELKKYYVFGNYFKDGKKQSTYELFKYPIGKAKKLLDQIVEIQFPNLIIK